LKKKFKYLMVYYLPVLIWQHNYFSGHSNVPVGSGFLRNIYIPVPGIRNTATGTLINLQDLCCFERFTFDVEKGALKSISCWCRLNRCW
jgi:hypothetical protein